MDKVAQPEESPSMPEKNRATPNPWIELGVKGQVRDGVYFIGSDEIWVTSIRGQRIVVSNICPHKMGPISCGRRQDNLVRCPWHGYWFDIQSGVCTPSLKLRRYEWKEDQGKEYVRLVLD